jgi:lysophospholipase L1-like esterase
VTHFGEHCRARGVRSIATFGDSITAGESASTPEHRWANLLASAIGAPLLRNRGIGGTVMQNSALATGVPKPGNGRSRFEADLLGEEKADALAILYGFNDARQVGSIAFTHDNFAHDYREVLAGLFAGGFAPSDICIGSPPHIPEAGFAVGSDGFAGQTRERFQAYVGLVKSIARDAGTFYAPVNERMATEGGDALISPDHVHPNDAGHLKIAEIFADATQLTTTTDQPP